MKGKLTLHVTHITQNRPRTSCLVCSAVRFSQCAGETVIPLYSSCTMNRNLRALLLLAGILLAVSCAAVAQIPASTIIQRLGYPPDSRLLIIHSDDLGMSHSVDVAAFEALEKGWISSASIMAPCPWFSEAAEFARHNPQLDLGLHLTL